MLSITLAEVLIMTQQMFTSLIVQTDDCGRKMIADFFFDNRWQCGFMAQPSYTPVTQKQ